MVILRSLFAILLLFCTLEGKAQISFYHVFGGTGYDRGEGIAELPDSSYIVTGASSSFENAPSQAFLLKLNKYGFHVWSKEYGGSEFEEGKRVLFVPNYGYYIVGASSSNGTDGFDGYVVFTDLSGNQQWEKWYDKGGWERFHDAILMPDTSIVLFGETNANQEETEDRYMVRIDKNGTVLWEQQSGGVGVDYFNKGLKMTDTTFAVVGTAYLADSLKSKASIAYYHIDGSLIWDTLSGRNGEYILNDVQFVANRLMCVGERLETGKTDKDNYQIFLTKDGNFISDDDTYSQYENRYVGFVNYTAPPGDKYFLVTQGNNPLYDYQGGEDCYVHRFSPAFYWDGYGVPYSALGQDQINQIIQTNDGYAAVVGFHTDPGFSTGGSSLFVVKLGNDYAFPSNAAPTIYSILSVENLESHPDLSFYPNPVNNLLYIDTESAIDRIEVSDLSGKQVFSAVHSVSSIETASWNSGTYLLRFSVNGNWYVRKVVKM